MLLVLCSRVGPQNLLSSPDACDTIDWKNEDIEHIGSLLNPFNEVGVLANELLGVFWLREDADTSRGNSFPTHHIRITNKVSGTLHFEMLPHLLIVNVVHDESDDFVPFEKFALWV